MPYGLPWTEHFVRQLSDKEFRDEFVAEQLRLRVALMIRALREQEDRHWSQTELGRQMGKPQSVISRVEDPDYGKLSLQTLLEIAHAFDLPITVDMPQWEDWFRTIGTSEKASFYRRSFDAERLIGQTQTASHGATSGKISNINDARRAVAGTSGSAPYELETPKTPVARAG